MIDKFNPEPTLKAAGTNPNRLQVHVITDDDLGIRFKNTCKARGIGQSKMLLQMIRFCLDNMKE